MQELLNALSPEAWTGITGILVGVLAAMYSGWRGIRSIPGPRPPQPQEWSVVLKELKQDLASRDKVLKDIRTCCETSLERLNRMDEDVDNLKVKLNRIDDVVHRNEVTLAAISARRSTR